ncbi:MAG: hypothetical protein HOC20_07320, partial [Chloroflexi bacterium]|nr:hypothetical protein [Chloroflexota bacterium]
MDHIQAAVMEIPGAEKSLAAGLVRFRKIHTTGQNLQSPVLADSHDQVVTGNLELTAGHWCDRRLIVAW